MICMAKSNQVINQPIMEQFWKTEENILFIKEGCQLTGKQKDKGGENCTQISLIQYLY